MVKRYVLTADDVVDNLTSTDTSIPLSANQGRVLNDKKQDVIQVQTMPTASTIYADKIVQYIGTSTTTYVNGYFYKCIFDRTIIPNAYRWVAKSVQAGGGGGGGEWGTITGTLSDQLDLQEALDGKVATETGKGLSENDYTTAEKTKLAGIAEGAEVNVNADWNATSGDAQILNKPSTLPNPSALTFTGAVTGSYDGSSEVSVNIPDSATWGNITGTLSSQTDLQTALDGKVNAVSGKGLSTNDYDNTAKGIVDGVTSALVGKVDKVTGKGLSTEDYTSAEKTKLAGIADGAEVNVQSDWNQTDNTADDFIKNKPSSMTPSSHASTHGPDGSDAITIAESQVTNLVTDLSAKQDIIQVSTMPTASESNLGKIVQYIGETTSMYTNGHFYKCVFSAVYRWISIDVQDKGVSWGDIDGILMNQTDLYNALNDKQNTVYYGSTEPTDPANGDLWCNDDTEAGTQLYGSDITVSPLDSDKIDVALGKKQATTNLVSSFQATPDDTHYPSEKLVKDSLDGKLSLDGSKVMTGTIHSTANVLLQADTATGTTYINADNQLNGTHIQMTGGGNISLVTGMGGTVLEVDGANNKVTVNNERVCLARVVMLSSKQMPEVGDVLDNFDILNENPHGNIYKCGNHVYHIDYIGYEDGMRMSNTIITFSGKISVRGFIVDNTGKVTQAGSWTQP